MAAKFPIIPLLEHLGFDEHMLVETERWRKIRCAIHDEREPSASYIAGDAGQAYNCFACEAKGDAIALAQQQLGLSYKQAVEFLEGLTGTTATTTNEQPARYKPVRLGETAPVHRRPPAKKRSRRRRVRIGDG